MATEANVDEFGRVDPPSAAPEKQMLETFLDWHRATVLVKIDGLSDEEMRRPGTPSGVSLLGLVKHHAAVERHWFRRIFAGEDVPSVWSRDDADADWRIEPDETTADIVALFNDEVERARAIVRDADLDDVARNAALLRYPPEPPGLMLRWIVVHMIEETARHNGHADILREAIDGQTGE
jgi:uncharacterized damage-inducible protein DinB